MAGYRQFHTKFWKDAWVIDLDPLERYLFSYLFTNEQSSISGIYELPTKIIQNETGLDLPFIKKTMQKFQDAKKVFYRDNIVWVVKMMQHHKNASPKTMTKVNNDISWIPDCDVKIAYLYYQKTGIYSIDIVSILNSESVSVIKSESLNESESEHAPSVSPIQIMIEQITGKPCNGMKDLKAVDELEKAGVIKEDIQAGYKWYTDQGNTFNYYGSIVKPSITAMNKRIQEKQKHKTVADATKDEPEIDYKLMRKQIEEERKERMNDKN